MRHYILSDIPFWVTFHFVQHSIFSDIPFEWHFVWVTFHFEWHSILSDIPFWVTFHFEWHSILSDIPFLMTFHFVWNSILSDIPFWVTFRFSSWFVSKWLNKNTSNVGVFASNPKNPFQLDWVQSHTLCKWPKILWKCFAISLQVYHKPFTSDLL